tara:strand:- start:319 stop:648 length:330 start_codon:yes stop_codon:yes gene_type:complete
MKIINFIKNLWKLLAVDQERFLKIIENVDATPVMVSALTQVSKIQDIHNEVIQQIAINQHGLSTVQGEIAASVSEIMSKVTGKSKSIKSSTQVALKDIFHKDDDDDIFH